MSGRLHCTKAARFIYFEHNADGKCVERKWVGPITCEQPGAGTRLAHLITGPVNENDADAVPQGMYRRRRPTAAKRPDPREQRRPDGVKERQQSTTEPTSYDSEYDGTLPDEYRRKPSAPRRHGPEDIAIDGTLPVRMRERPARKPQKHDQPSPMKDRKDGPLPVGIRRRPKRQKPEGRHPDGSLPMGLKTSPTRFSPKSNDIDGVLPVKLEEKPIAKSPEEGRKPEDGVLPIGIKKRPEVKDEPIETRDGPLPRALRRDVPEDPENRSGCRDRRPVGWCEEKARTGACAKPEFKKVSE